MCAHDRLQFIQKRVLRNEANTLRIINVLLAIIAIVVILIKTEYNLYYYKKTKRPF